MANEIVEKVIAWAVPFVLGGTLSAVLSWLLFFRAIRDGLQCLLRAEIIRQNEKWTAKRYCPIYAKQALSRAYKAYHALKGNDVATALYDEVIELPERKEEVYEN
jgi:hypothetical protein